MAEKTFDVIPVGIDYECDQCQKGLMVFTKFIADSVTGGDTPFQHTCNSCGNVQKFAEKYPTVRFNRKQ